MARPNQRTSKARQPNDSAESTNIPEDEQWRLINESGILNKVDGATTQESVVETDAPLAEEVFGAVVIIIPISFLLLLMEILIHFQYGKHPPLSALVDRMVSGVPILSLFIFYTTRYKSHRRMQLLLFLLGSLSGSRMLYLLNRGSWLLNMRQCPPLATIWVYSIVQLELLPAVVSLGFVGLFVWWRGLSLRL